MKNHFLLLFSLVSILSFTAIEQITAFSLEAEIVSSTDVSCFGDADGAATATASGGEPPYSFLWSNGSTDSSIFNLEAGLYEVTVTDTDGTTATASVTISQPDLLEVMLLNSNSPSCAGGENGSLNISGKGGSSPYQYLWSTGDTGPNLLGLGAGDYEVTVTDQNGCEATESYNLFDPNPITLSDLIVENESCVPGGDGSITLIPHVAHFPIEIHWSNDSTGAIISQLEAGVYTATVTDGVGCTAVFNVEVEGPEPVTYEVETEDVSCPGGNDGSITIHPLGDNHPYFFSWESGLAGPTQTGLESKTYLFSIRDIKGCEVIDSVYIQEPDSIAIDLELTNPTCATCSNGMIVANVSGGSGNYQYSWSVATFQNQNYISQLEPDFYALTVTDENGCESSVTVELTSDTSCRDIAPYFYNHTNVFCNTQDLEGFCFEMGPAFAPAFAPWPGCEQCCDFNNPQWLTFIASESGELSLDLEISNCMEMGVHIAVYELGYQTLFNPSEQSPGIQPEAHMLISDCNLVSTPQTGIINLTVPDVQAGQLYGIVVDGSVNDLCKIEVLEVLSGGDGSSQPVDSIPSIPEFDNSSYGFSPGDTLCQGAESVVFSIAVDTPKPWLYIWTLDGEMLLFPDSHLPSIPIDFPNAGTFEVCVSATNYCHTSPQKCTEVVVQRLPSFHHSDTVCIRKVFLLDGPFGTEPFGPFVNAGDYEMERVVAETNGCLSDIYLDIHVIGDNFDEPTELLAVICGGENYIFPEPGHPDPQVFNSTGLYGQDGELSILQTGFPGSAFACDSFFTLELIVLETEMGSLDFTCTEAQVTIFPTTQLTLPGLEAYGDDITVDYEWRRGSDGHVLGAGSWSDSSDLVITLDYSDFAGNTEEFHLHLFTRYSNDPDETACENVFSIELNREELTELEIAIYGPDTIITGEGVVFQVEEMVGLVSLFSWSFNPEPDDLVIDFTTKTATMVYPEPGIVEICVTGTNFCGLEDMVCIEVVVDSEVNVPYYPGGDLDLKVFPNPLNEILHVHSGKEIGRAAWEIYNPVGLQVLSGSGVYERDIVVSLKSLPSGVYILKLELEEGPVSFKVVKQK